MALYAGFACALAFSQGSGVRVAAVAAAVEVAPRGVVSTALRVTNDTKSARSFAVDANLPEGWKALTPRVDVDVPAGATEIRVVSFVTAADAPAGEYVIRYRLVDPDTRAAAAECDLKVRVLAAASLDFRVVDSPSYAVSGETYEIACLAANTGNTELLVRFRAVGDYEYTVEYRGLTGVDETLLAVGERRAFSILVTTSPDIARFVQHHLQISALLRNPDPAAPVAKALGAASVVVDLVPASTDLSYIVHYLPVALDTRAGFDLGSAFEADASETVSAKGSIDDDGVHDVELFAHKRIGTDTDPLWFDPQDRYFASYSNDAVSVALGDDAYRLSPLLGSPGLGRGARIRGAFGAGSIGDIGAGAFAFADVWKDGGARAAAAFGDWTFPHPETGDPMYRAGLSLHSPLDGRMGVGLSQTYEPFSWLEADADFAVQSKIEGGVVPALYLSTKGDWKPARWLARFVRAWPGFEGMYRDVQLLQLSGGTGLLEGALALDASLYWADRNLDLDGSLDSADRTTDVTLGASYTVPGPGTKLGASWQNQHRVDRLPDPGYDSWNNIVGASVNQDFAPFTAGLGVKFDFGSDAVADTDALRHEESLSASYRLDETWIFNAGLKLTGLAAASGSRTGFGHALDASYAKDRLNVGARLQGQYGFDPAGWVDTSLGLSGTAALAFRNGHTATARSEVTLTGTIAGWTPGVSLSIGYRVPLDVPVGRKRDAVVVRGRVYDAGTNAAMPGVLVRVNGIVCVTDSKGGYVFYLPRAENAYLQLDRSSVDAKLVPTVPMPVAIRATGGDQVIDIGMVESCAVSGVVALYEAAPGTVAGAAPEYVRARGLANLVVELSDGLETRRRLTNRDGAFSFPDLKPGRYALTVIAGQLPLYHSLVPPSMTLDLSSGEARDVEFRVQMEPRTIQIMETEGDLLLESPEASEEGTVGNGR